MQSGPHLHRAVILGYFALAVSSCSSDGKDTGSQGQAGAPVAGQAPGVSGAQATPAAGSGGGSVITSTGGATGGAGRASGAGSSATAGTKAPAAGSTAAGTPATAGSGTAGSGGSSGSQAAAGAGGAAAGASAPDVACDPKDKTAAPTNVEFAKPGEGPGLAKPLGEFMPVMEADPGIPTHTIIRPEPLGKIKHPILAWGEGGCGKSGNIGMFSALFMEFASQGILIVADGPPRSGGPTMAGSDAKPLLYAIDWAIKENERPCSQYYHKLDVTKLAVSGQSCGGLMAIQAATDPKITTAFPYNSGLFSRDQTIYNALHAPMAIFDGGSEDIAYANGLADFNAITKIPMLFANPTSCSSNAHVCTFFDANAGEFGRAGVAWMRWHLLGDEGATGKGMFIGDSCGLCGSKWTMMWKNKPM